MATSIARFKSDFIFTLCTITMFMWLLHVLVPRHFRVKISLTVNVQNNQRQAFFPHNAEAIQEGTTFEAPTSTTAFDTSSIDAYQ
jgi:hypothetical protein